MKDIIILSLVLTVLAPFVLAEYVYESLWK